MKLRNVTEYPSGLDEEVQPIKEDSIEDWENAIANIVAHAKADIDRIMQARMRKPGFTADTGKDSPNAKMRADITAKVISGLKGGRP